MNEESAELKQDRLTRRRAVRLRPDALDLLTAALSEAWNRNPGSGKFTREEKARLLGVSLATSIRILKGQGVDRPTLATAFKSVGLTWDDAYCELDSQAPGVESPPEPSPPAPSLQRPPQRRRLDWRLAVVTVAVLLLLPFSLSGGSGEPDWYHAYSESVAMAEKAYHAADYQTARIHAQKAIDLARRHEAAGQMAEASRLAGDMAGASGDLEAAKTYYSDAITFRKSLGNMESLPSLREALGGVEIKLGQYAEARRNLMDSLEGFQSRNDQAGIAMACRGLGTLAHQQGLLDESEEWFERSLSALDKDKEPGIVADVKARRALVLRDWGRLAEAKEILATCMAYWTSEQHPRWIARTRLQLATVERLAGNSAEAHEMLAKSRDEFANLGDSAGVAECQEWLADGGIKSAEGLLAENGS